MSDEHNPPAFPRDHRNLGHNGMTLRDWFAGQVIGSVFLVDEDDALATMARTAYRIADAMLAERAK